MYTLANCNTRKCMGIPEEINLTEGANYMVTYNIDTQGVHIPKLRLGRFGIMSYLARSDHRGALWVADSLARVRPGVPTSAALSEPAPTQAGIGSMI